MPEDTQTTTPDRGAPIGRVCAPQNREATSQEFYFWPGQNEIIERGQIVAVISETSEGTLTHYGIVEEVYRCSRAKGVAQEVDQHDGRTETTPPFDSDGYDYAKVTILAAEPNRLAAPRDRAPVFLATEDDVNQAYGGEDVTNALSTGLVRNGGERTTGVGKIDLDYLLGANGGHLNVNGAAGRGTKSSFLLHAVYLLLDKARCEEESSPSGQDRLLVVPIIFNVKSYDLFYIDWSSARYNPERHASDWTALGIPEPGPFHDVTYLAPQNAHNSLAVSVPGRGAEVEPYSWGLQDLIEKGLFQYLFSTEDAANDNFQGLVLDLEERLTDERWANGNTQRRLDPPHDNDGQPITTLDGLANWARQPSNVQQLVGAQHHEATIRKLARRLRLVALESRGVLRRNEPTGHPLNVQRDGTCGPILVDLNSLAGAPAMQRFVVATVLRQLVEARTHAPVPGLKYLVVVDELNRFAPRGGRDPITKLVETVAAEMRSQGILLFGAQQQASRVSETVIENAGIRALGKTGALELSNTVWRSLSPADKARAESLQPNEKMILQDTFRKPMHVRVPFPAWAMRREEAIQPKPTQDEQDQLNANIDE